MPAIHKRTRFPEKEVNYFGTTQEVRYHEYISGKTIAFYRTKYAHGHTLVEARDSEGNLLHRFSNQPMREEKQDVED